MPITPATDRAIVIGLVLTVHRERLFINQSTVATAANVGQSTWSKIENGKSALTLGALFQIADVLRCPAQILVRDIDIATRALRRNGILVSSRPLTARAAQKNGFSLLSRESLRVLIEVALP